MSLLVDFCDHKAAKHAVMHWHYSKTMPLGRMVKMGVWEEGDFIGAVIFGRGGNRHLGRPYGVENTGVCELVRVALKDHQTTVTQIVSLALRQLKESSPGIRVVISFADSSQGHLGTIYQAGNWMYLGTTTPTPEYFYHGTWVHHRRVTGTAMGSEPIEVAGGMSYTQLAASLPQRPGSVKFRYAYPLDKKMRRLLNSMSLPYPTADDLAAQVSEAKHRPTRSEGQVQSLGAALDLMEG